MEPPRDSTLFHSAPTTGRLKNGPGKSEQDPLIKKGHNRCHPGRSEAYYVEAHGSRRRWNRSGENLIRPGNAMRFVIPVIESSPAGPPADAAQVTGAGERGAATYTTDASFGISTRITGPGFAAPVMLFSLPPIADTRGGTLAVPGAAAPRSKEPSQTSWHSPDG